MDDKHRICSNQNDKGTSMNKPKTRKRTNQSWQRGPCQMTISKNFGERRRWRAWLQPEERRMLHQKRIARIKVEQTNETKNIECVCYLLRSVDRVLCLQFFLLLVANVRIPVVGHQEKIVHVFHRLRNSIRVIKIALHPLHIRQIFFQNVAFFRFDASRESDDIVFLCGIESPGNSTSLIDTAKGY